MNLLNIISEIEKTDPEIYDRLDTRRNVMKGFANKSGKIAIAAIPFALGSMFQKAYAGSKAPSDIVVDTLKFALVLEYLESEFYKQAVASSVVPSGAAKAALTVIRDHEVAHVAFLRTAITSAGGDPGPAMTAANFDFTAKGNFPKVFTDYGFLLAVAQTFEDTGVRAYKGQAGNLISSPAYLTAALRIHSVEARHAAHLREMRKDLGALIPAGVDVKPWITLDQSGIATPAVQASYAGEQNVVQAGVTITNIGGKSISAAAASEAFDEPLTKDAVLAIVAPFLK